MPKVSKRLMAVPESPIRKLVPYAEQAKRSGAHVYHLNIGQPDLQTPAPILGRLRELEMPVVAYGHSRGRTDFLEFLHGYYAGVGMELEPEQLMVTTGGSEGITMALTACTEPGDQVISPEPLYANYLGFGGMLGIEMVPATCLRDQGWAMPDLEALVTPRTRAILMCNPANPTGAVYDRETMLGLIAFARKHDLFLIVDEAYREFVFDGDPAPSALALEAETLGDPCVVMVDSLSKRYSLCGARLGCVASRHTDVMAGVFRIAQARLSTSVIAQAVGAGAGELGPEYLEGVVAEYKSRRDLAQEILARDPRIVTSSPAGAFFQIAELPVDDAESFCRFLLTEFRRDGKTTMLAPAAGFYLTPNLGNREVRMAFVLGGDDLRDAVEIVLAGLQAYPGQL